MGATPESVLFGKTLQASLSVFALSRHTQMAKVQHKVKQGLRICNSTLIGATTQVNSLAAKSHKASFARGLSFHT
jgi:hypothetical protein